MECRAKEVKQTVLYLELGQDSYLLPHKYTVLYSARNS